MLDTYGTIRVTRLTQARRFDAAHNLLYHTSARFAGLRESSQPCSAAKRAFCASSEVEMKRCVKCGEWKDERAFRPKRRGCRECERISNKVYNAVHAEERRAAARAYRQNYPGGPQAYDRKRYQSAAENRRAYTQKWREENRDRYLTYKRSDRNRASGRAYYRRNKERMKAQARFYRQNNKDKVNARTHRRKARLRGSKGSFTAMEWQALCQKYSYRCLCCGKREPDIKLTIDHVLPIVQGGTNTIDNLQPLCSTCNSSKGDRHIDYRPDQIKRPQVEQLSLW